MFQLELKKKTQELGEALDAARKISVKMHDEPEKSSELKGTFDKAMKHFETTKLEMQTLEKQQLIEVENQRANEPKEPIQHLAPNEAESNEAKEKHWKAQHKEAFGVYVREGVRAASEKFDSYGPREKHVLLGTTDALGGFLIPEDFRAEIIRNVAGLSNFRLAGARTVPTSLRSLVFPTITVGANDQYPTDLQKGDSTSQGPTFNWKAEGATAGGAAPPDQDKPTFAQATIPIHLWQPPAVELTMELLDDSVIPLEPLLATLFGEIMALDQDWAFTLGNGTVQPAGIMLESITKVNTATSGGVDYGTTVDWYYSVPAQYRATSTIMTTSATFALFVQMETTGPLVFPPNTPPGQLFGRQVVFNEFIAGPAGLTDVAIVGDFKHYVIAERMDMRIQRLVERFAPNVGILPTSRIGGLATRLAPFRILRTLV